MSEVEHSAPVHRRIRHRELRHGVERGEGGDSPKRYFLREKEQNRRHSVDSKKENADHWHLISIHTIKKIFGEPKDIHRGKKGNQQYNMPRDHRGSGTIFELSKARGRDPDP